MLEIIAAWRCIIGKHYWEGTITSDADGIRRELWCARCHVAHGKPTKNPSGP